MQAGRVKMLLRAVIALRLCIYNTHTIIPGRIAEGKQVYYMYMQKEIKGKT